MDAIFADENLAQIMREKLPENERRELLAFVGQSARGYVPTKSSPNASLVRILNSACATFGIGWNPASAFKQLSGALAFGLETGIPQNLKDIAWAILTPQGRQTMGEVLKNQLMRDRREAGINPAIALAISQFQNGSFGTGFSALNRLVAALKPFAMIGGMDTLAAALGGAGIYSRLYSKYRLEHSHQDAERLASLDFAEIVERTQQSNFIHNKSGSVRNETGLGRALMLFRSAPQQMLSFEVNAFKAWRADKNNPAKRQRLCDIILINHILVPAAFNGLGVFINLLLGDDWENDDWLVLIASTLLDVLGGVAVGALLKGAIAIGAGAANRDLSSDVIPAAGLARIGNQIGLMLGDIRQGEFSENLTKRLKNIAKQINAPARYAFKLYDNATDNKKGALW